MDLQITNNLEHQPNCYICFHSRYYCFVSTFKSLSQKDHNSQHRPSIQPICLFKEISHAKKISARLFQGKSNIKEWFPSHIFKEIQDTKEEWKVWSLNVCRYINILKDTKEKIYSLCKIWLTLSGREASIVVSAFNY